MKITEQNIIGFFSLKNEVFLDIELSHIRKLIKKTGISIKEVIAEEQFQVFCTEIITNKINYPFNSSGSLNKLALSLKISEINYVVFEQLLEYLSFYIKYIKVLLDKNNSLDNFMIISELRLTRKNLPVYNKRKKVEEDINSFSRTKKLDLVKLNNLLKLNFEYSVISSQVEEDNFKPFLRYNANISYAVNNEKVNDNKINFLGSLFELKKFIELLIENNLIEKCDNTSTKISKIFLVRGKEIFPEQLTKPNGKVGRISLLKHIIENCKTTK